MSGVHEPNGLHRVARAWRSSFVAVVALGLVLVGCSSTPPSLPTSPSASASTTPGSTSGPVQPVGTPTVLASGLTSPWSVVRLASGSALISLQGARTYQTRLASVSGGSATTNVDLGDPLGSVLADQPRDQTGRQFHAQIVHVLSDALFPNLLA